MWTQLLALQVYPGKVLRIEVPSGRVETVIEDAGMFPDGIVVQDGVVYWTTMGAPETNPAKSGQAARSFMRRNGGVHAERLDGGARREVVASGAITTGMQLACGGDGTLYFADRDGHRVSRVRADGGGLSDLVVRADEEGAMGECAGVAADPVHGFVYWTQPGPAEGGRGRIFRAGLEIPRGESAEHRSDVEELWSDLPEPMDLCLEGGMLYWTDRGAPLAGNTLNRAPVPGTGEPGADPEILADGFQDAVGLAVDGAAGLAYVSDLGGAIRMVPLPGGTVGAPRELVRLPGPVSGLCGLAG